MLDIKYNDKPEREWVAGSILKDGYDDDGTLFILITTDRDADDGYNTIVLYDADKICDFEPNHSRSLTLNEIKDRYKLVATPDEYKMTLELP